MKVRLSKNVTIESESDASLRSDECVVITNDKDGTEVQGFIFHVNRQGIIWKMGPAISLIDGVDIVA